MKIGFLFPGQGAQTVGMGKDIYEKYKEAQEVYNKVKELTGIDIAQISFDGSEENLNETKLSPEGYASILWKDSSRAS